MSDVAGALQHSEGPQLGTLADAWLPCRLVDFERDIACLSEEQLLQNAAVTNKPLVKIPAPSCGRCKNGGRGTSRHRRPAGQIQSGSGTPAKPCNARLACCSWRAMHRGSSGDSASSRWVHSSSMRQWGWGATVCCCPVCSSLAP